MNQSFVNGYPKQIDSDGELHTPRHFLDDGSMAKIRENNTGFDYDENAIDVLNLEGIEVVANSKHTEKKFLYQGEDDATPLYYTYPKHWKNRVNYLNAILPFIENEN